VPGTHDLALGHRVLDQLLAAGSGDVTPIPAFDKALDDRVPESRWPVFEGPVQVILLEGWCLGARPQSEDDLARPVNRLEAEEDAGGQWRGYVNDCLKNSYHEFFERLDTLVMLRAPSMDCVLEWRRLQEHKLAQRHKNASKECAGDGGAQSLRIMSDTEVQRFIMHYQRVTEHCLRTLPNRADVLIPVGADHFMETPVWNDRI
jgi:D-glycerate 3-kinase